MLRASAGTANPAIARRPASPMCRRLWTVTADSDIVGYVVLQHGDGEPLPDEGGTCP
jgi:hypothetical protein